MASTGYVVTGLGDETDGPSGMDRGESVDSLFRTPSFEDPIKGTVNGIHTLPPNGWSLTWMV